MAFEELHVGTIGEPIEVLLKNPDGTAYDLTGQTALEFKFSLNGGATVTKNATVVGPLVDGHLKWIWVSDDLSAEGPLRYQWVVTKSTTIKAYSPIRERYVYPNL